MSCLFNSISALLRMDSHSCRNTICDYLEADKPIIDGMATHDVLALDRPNYIAAMRMTHTWGGAIEIQAACNVWNVRIVVDNRRDGLTGSPIEFLPLTGDVTQSLYIYWTGGHYEPMHVSR